MKTKKGLQEILQTLDFTGADMRNRTADLLITNQLLYQLSYIGLKKLSTKVVPVNINFMVVCQDWIDTNPS